MKHERRFAWWGMTMLLGAGSALAVGLVGGMLSPALAQTGSAVSAVSASLPTACPALEALVSDEVDGPDPWGQGEVIKFATSLSQGTLTNNLSPLGAPNLDSPEDMAFDLNGNVVTADEGITTGVAQVVRVDKNTGVRTLISGAGLGSGPALNGPYSIAVEGTGNILVLDVNPTTFTSRVLRITPAGARSVLSSNAVGAGPALGFTVRVRVLSGVIYRTEVFSNRLQTGTTNFDMPYDVVRNACDNSFYVLHTGATGVLGNVMRVNATGTRTLFATYTASSPSSNYSVLMRPLILLPGGGGPTGGGGGGGL